MSTKIRALLLAEACNPEWVSVPLVGWSMVKALADEVDAHLVTQIRNRDALLRAGLREGVDFTALDTEAIAGKLWNVGSWLRGGAGKGWTTLTAISALANYHFEHVVWKTFRHRLERREFDVVHRVTPVSPTVPSLIATHCRKLGVPFILGPLNGGIAWPRGFEKTRWQEREWLSYIRSAYKWMYGYRSTRRDASAILIGSMATMEQMPQRYHHKCFYMPENAVDPVRFPAGEIRKPQETIQAVFLGRLVPYKGADMLIDAATPLLRSKKLHLSILGDGPQKGELEEMIKTRGIGDSVEMLGWIPHHEVRDRLAKSDILTFPSIREFGGGVVLEAMAAGLPPLVVNYGGPGELVTPKTGWTVDIGPRESIVSGIRTTLEEICNHPRQITEKSEASLKRAFQQFTWEHKARQVVSVYEWALDERPKPNFPMPTPDLEEADIADAAVLESVLA